MRRAEWSQTPARTGPVVKVGESEVDMDTMRASTPEGAVALTEHGERGDHSGPVLRRAALGRQPLAEQTQPLRRGDVCCCLLLGVGIGRDGGRRIHRRAGRRQAQQAPPRQAPNQHDVEQAVDRSDRLLRYLDAFAKHLLTGHHA